MTFLKRILKRLFYGFGWYLWGFQKRVRLNPGCSLQVVSADGPSFFGYFDTSPIHPAKNRLLYHQVAEVGVELIQHDLDSGIPRIVGRSLAWNYQQGSRLQWLGHKGDLVFNIVHEGYAAGCIVQAGTGEMSVTEAVQCVSPDGSLLLSVDYGRITAHNPEYGYSVLPFGGPERSEAFRLVRLPDNQLLQTLSVDRVCKHEPKAGFDQSGHEFNHMCFSPDGLRIAFIHRWYPSRGTRKSRFMLFDHSTDQLSSMLDTGMVSHYTWLDSRRIIVFANDESGKKTWQLVTLEQQKGTSASPVEALQGRRDGHPSLSPDGQWLAIDTYPDWQRYQQLYLMHLETGSLTEIARLKSPLAFQEGHRCDLHPRWDREGNRIIVDGTFTGIRTVNIIDVNAIVGTGQ